MQDLLSGKNCHFLGATQLKKCPNLGTGISSFESPNNSRKMWKRVLEMDSNGTENIQEYSLKFA